MGYCGYIETAIPGWQDVPILRPNTITPSLNYSARAIPVYPPPIEVGMWSSRYIFSFSLPAFLLF